MVFNQGLGGPKANLKGVADGQLVNIPTLFYPFNKVRNLVGKAIYWIIVVSQTQEWLTESLFFEADFTEQVSKKSFI